MPDFIFGETITYTQATGWYHEGKQLPQDGPYTGGIVGFEDNGWGGTVVQVRADGWGGDEPIYAVKPSDIITHHSALPLKARKTHGCKTLHSNRFL